MSTWPRLYGFGSKLEAGQLGWAPVHFAAVEGNLEILTLLLDAGESVNLWSGALWGELSICPCSFPR